MFDAINVFLFIFSLFGLAFTGWYCLKTRKGVPAVHLDKE